MSTVCIDNDTVHKRAGERDTNADVGRLNYPSAKYGQKKRENDSALQPCAVWRKVKVTAPSKGNENAVAQNRKKQRVKVANGKHTVRAISLAVCNNNRNKNEGCHNKDYLK